MNLTQPIHRAAVMTPNALATVCGERSHTWRQIHDRVSRLGGALRSLGVDRGDRVAILSLNSDRYLEYYFACWWIGAVVVPMNIRWSPSENAYSLRDSGAEVLFVDQTFAPAIPAIKAEAELIRELIYLGDDDKPEGMRAYEEFLSSGDPVEDVRAGGEEMGGIYYTGGTTGFPKGVMLAHQALWLNGLIMAKHVDTQPGCRYLHAAPMFHLADGAGSMAVTAMGGTHYFVAAFTPDGAIRATSENEISHALLVPTMIDMVLAHPDFTPEKFKSLNWLLYGASPMPEGLMRQAIEKLSGVNFVQGYGQTELAPIVTVMPPEYHVLEGPNAGKLRSAGIPAVGLEVRIVDEDGNPCKTGEVGEIVARGATAMLGYWNRPEETAATLKDGWVHTGDGAYMDEDGFIFIVDRMKDMIVTGGENVFSAEVESAISTHPGVAGVAVVGIPSDKWGEAVHAIVIPREGHSPSAEKIIDHCREQIANYKLPRSVDFRSDPFPLSGAGKVLKRDLRARYWEGRGRSVN